MLRFFYRSLLVAPIFLCFAFVVIFNLDFSLFSFYLKFVSILIEVCYYHQGKQNPKFPPAIWLDGQHTVNQKRDHIGSAI